MIADMSDIPTTQSNEQHPPAKPPSLWRAFLWAAAISAFILANVWAWNADDTDFSGFMAVFASAAAVYCFAVTARMIWNLRKLKK
jgi:hypothetical protein